MNSFIMSAKSGDQVQGAFTRLAAMLAGVVLNVKDLESLSNNAIVPATIIDHAQHDTNVHDGKLPDYHEKPKSSCVVS